MPPAIDLESGGTLRYAGRGRRCVAIGKAREEMAVWKAISIPLVVGTAAGLGYFFTHYDVKRQNGHIIISPRGPAADVPDLAELSGVPLGWKSIRVATFDVQPLNRTKLASSLVTSHLAELIRDFDVVALQGIQASNTGVLRDLVAQVNAPGKTFDFAVAPEVNRQEVSQYATFLFNRAKIDLDRSTVCSVDDPSGRLRQKPLVGLFRARGPDASQAFTFLLINVQLEQDSSGDQLDLASNVLAAVAERFKAEDDVILLGNFAVDARRTNVAERIPNVSWAVSGTISTTRGTALPDNVVFNRSATNEYLGRSGVVDLIRRLNIDVPAALAIAEHMPVWAEFSIYENGQAGLVAPTPE
ncbi:MAG: hypothetical protein JW809_17310 [Pirellulales bacterium]|nr:hypothetical protein [Pirellulales bacterium]